MNFQLIGGRKRVLDDCGDSTDGDLDFDPPCGAGKASARDLVIGTSGYGHGKEGALYVKPLWEVRSSADGEGHAGPEAEGGERLTIPNSLLDHRVCTISILRVCGVHFNPVNVSPNLVYIHTPPLWSLNDSANTCTFSYFYVPMIMIQAFHFVTFGPSVTVDIPVHT